MLINLSNHPYESWGETQKKAAQKFGTCYDMAFPQIAPSCNETEVNELAETYLNRLTSFLNKEKEITVHVMGEMTFCYAIINKLKAIEIKCIASCTKRDVVQDENGNKVVHFEFERFRYYF